jgi:hypothetical protein
LLCSWWTFDTCRPRILSWFAWTNKSYYFLCAVCDAAEQAVRKATRERKQALKKKNDAKPKPLFEYQVIKPLPCGCTGGK